MQELSTYGARSKTAQRESSSLGAYQRDFRSELSGLTGPAAGAYGQAIDRYNAPGATLGLQRLSGALSGYYGTGEVAQANRNRTEEVTSLLKQLASGADTRSLGLYTQEQYDEFSAGRQALGEANTNFFFGADRTSPLDRVFESLFTRQASQGFGFGSGSVQARSGGDPVNAVAALRAGIFRPEELGPGRTAQLAVPEAAQLSSRFNRVPNGPFQAFAAQLGSQGAGRFNVYNPPPFFNVL